MLPRALRLPAALVLASACSKAPEPAPVSQPAPPATAEPAAEQPAPPALSEEDLALIAADPKDLTPELRRKRAYALRRKIMQNPDSPTARMLEDLQKAQADGTLQVPGQGGVRLTLPGSAPQGGPPPAGARPDEPPPPPSQP
jgi:hypothetical protein